MLVEMVKVKAKYEVKAKPLTEASLMMVAKYALLTYYYKRIYRLFRLNCNNCTSEQRHECHTMRLPSECQKGKARRLVSLDQPVENKNGDKLTRLHGLMTHPKSMDPNARLDARLDARHILQRLPKRLVKIAYKIYAGIPLEKEEKKYLKHWRKVYPAPFDWRRDHLDEGILEQFRNTQSQLSMHRQVCKLNLYARKLNLDEGILELLRKAPQGMTRPQLCRRLQVLVRKLNWYLNRLIKKQQVIAVTREGNIHGGYPSTLYFIAGVEIPEEKSVAAERDERIRQAYFIEGWSINRINRELHHGKMTIHRAIQKVEQPALV